MTEFQGNLLLAQMTRLEEQSRTRERNARYLTSMLKEIPGISPAKLYEGCTRNAYHLYMFRYKSETFGGLPRAKFLSALDAEGIPCSAGYSPLNKESFLPTALNSKGFRRIYPKEILDRYEERNLCPANDQLCHEGVWFTQIHVPGNSVRHGPGRRRRVEDPRQRGSAAPRLKAGRHDLGPERTDSARIHRARLDPSGGGLAQR